MKNGIEQSNSKKYVLLFVLVMSLNIALVFLFKESLAQIKTEDFSSQQAVRAEVKDQKDCPLRIAVLNVDNAAPSSQIISYTVQNIGTKSIRAYTLLGDGKKDGKVITSSFGIKLFPTGKLQTSDISIERESIQPDDTILLSIDYVEFEDGSNWGEDTVGKSKSFVGERSGRMAAVGYVKGLIEKQDATGLASYLSQIVADIEVVVPDNKESEEWKRGYQTGYKSVIAILQRNKGNNREQLIKQLDEIEMLAK